MKSKVKSFLVEKASPAPVDISEWIATPHPQISQTGHTLHIMYIVDKEKRASALRIKKQKLHNGFIGLHSITNIEYTILLRIYK